MAPNEIPDGNLRLNICFDMNDVAERRFVELFRSIPPGFKARFARHLLSSNLPASDDELDLMLAKFIRQHKGVGQGRGRPRRKPGESTKPQAALASVSAVERQPSGTGGAREADVVQVDLRQFAGLAGVAASHG